VLQRLLLTPCLSYGATKCGACAQLRPIAWEPVRKSLFRSSGKPPWDPSLQRHMRGPTLAALLFVDAAMDAPPMDRPRTCVAPRRLLATAAEFPDVCALRALQVANVVSKPENDELSLVEASRSVGASSCCLLPSCGAKSSSAQLAAPLCQHISPELSAASDAASALVLQPCTPAYDALCQNHDVLTVKACTLQDMQPRHRRAHPAGHLLRLP